MEESAYEFKSGYWCVLHELERLKDEYKIEHKMNMRKLKNGERIFNESFFDRVTQETEHLLLISRMMRICGTWNIWEIPESKEDAYNQGIRFALDKILALIQEFEKHAPSEEKHSVVFLYVIYKRLCGALYVQI